MSLLALLTDGARFDAEYRGELSNHLPMALVALQRLGASDTRLQEFAQAYAARLDPAPAPAEWPAGDAWPGRFGERAAWPAYRSLLRQWLAFEGAEPVLQQTLRALLPGCGAAAFHGMIRSAYAVQAAPASELADALAYWACRWFALPHADAGQGAETDLPAVLQRLPTRQVPGALISERMQHAAQHRDHVVAAAQLRIDGATLERLSRQAARLYAASGNFTVLHLVTSAHALRVLLPFVDDETTAIAHYWRAYAAGVVASGLRLDEPAAPAPWQEIIAAALDSADEHFVKLVDSCREEERAYGGDDWRHAASRALRQARK